MPTPLNGFRRLLVNHANSLRRQDAEGWLDYHRLSALHDDPGLYDHLRLFLTMRRRVNTGKALLYIKLFQDLVDVMSDVGDRPIPVVALKGIALLETLYPSDIGLREMADIDLLVPENRIDEAVQRLEGVGFQETVPSHRLRRVAHHRVLVRHSGQGGAFPSGIVELHSRLDSAYGHRTTWDDLTRFGSLIRSTVHDRRAWVLNPAAELVFLLIHCYKHLPFSMLGREYEILELAEVLPQRRLPEIGVLARRQRSRHALAAATGNFRSAFGPEVLPQISVDDLRVNRARMALHEALFVGKGRYRIDPISPPMRLSRWIEELRSYLLVDTADDAAREFIRMAQIHFHARWPTRISGGE